VKTLGEIAQLDAVGRWSSAGRMTKIHEEYLPATAQEVGLLSSRPAVKGESPFWCAPERRR
jgi:hypothetical protein